MAAHPTEPTYLIQTGTLADALAGTGITGNVVFTRSVAAGGASRAAMAVTIPSKVHKEIHDALSALARQWEAGVSNPALPANHFKCVLSVNVSIVAHSDPLVTS